MLRFAEQNSFCPMVGPKKFHLSSANCGLVTELTGWAGLVPDAGNGHVPIYKSIDDSLIQISIYKYDWIFGRNIWKELRIATFGYWRVSLRRNWECWWYGIAVRFQGEKCCCTFPLTTLEFKICSNGVPISKSHIKWSLKSQGNWHSMKPTWK